GVHEGAHAGEQEVAKQAVPGSGPPVQPEADQAECERPLEAEREAEQRRAVGEVVPVDVVNGLVAGEDRAQLDELVACEASPVAVVRPQREPDGGPEPSVSL